MSVKKIIYFLSLSFFLSACATKEYAKQESVFLVFKTPTFKHADLGFFYENPEELKVEIYSSGQPVLALKIGKSSICMSLLECMGKTQFNKEVLSVYYPKDILSRILRGKVIFASKGLVKTGNGFTQVFKKEGKYNINYSVLNKQIIFRDTINDIKIKMKRMGT